MSKATEQLIDVAITDIACIDVSTTVREAMTSVRNAAWIVVTDKLGRPVGVLRGGDLLRREEMKLLTEFVHTPVALLPGHLSIRESIRSWPIQEQLTDNTAEIVSVIVLVGERIAGVWPVESLAE